MEGRPGPHCRRDPFLVWTLRLLRIYVRMKLYCGYTSTSGTLEKTGEAPLLCPPTKTSAAAVYYTGFSFTAAPGARPLTTGFKQCGLMRIVRV